jgi:hypothetical protein
VTPYDALVALAVVALALAAGARVWRSRREDRATDFALRTEARSMRWQAAAMAAELARRHRAGEGLDPEFFAQWRLSAPTVYPVTSALGAIGREGIDRLGYFHAQLADARVRLAEARAAGRIEPTPYRMLSHLVRAVNHVAPWLDRGRSWEPYPLPDLADANRLLGEFEGGAEPIALAYLWADCAARD